MFGNPTAERAAIEATYEDICTIERFTTETVGNIDNPITQVIATGIICALSQKSLTTTTQTESKNEVRYEIKLFCAPEIDIKPGDIIKVKRFGRDNPVGSETEYKSTGEPMLYATHQEVILLRDLNA